MDGFTHSASTATTATPTGGKRRKPMLARARHPQKIMMFAHRHPEISKGGAEIAAYRLFKELTAREDCEAWFIGCDPTMQPERMGAVFLQPFSDKEFLYLPGEFDWFKFANRDSRFPAEITRLLEEIAPDVVHFHHYIAFGVEAFYHVKKALPDCQVFVTLHEFLAICHHFGQMVSKEHHSRCPEASPMRCQRCFPDIGRSDFFLRKRYIQRFFDLVDGFIAPSRFLADRYVQWGIPTEKMTVIENVISEQEYVAPLGGDQGGPLRIGFFGQISPLKGINVLLDAARILEQAGETQISFELFGEYRTQPTEFQTDFLARLAQVGRNVNFHGPYDQGQVDMLMQSVDAVLVPSIWWENSPVVIQEALRNRRPVLCSNIGGMAEKVRDGIDGYHFPVASPIGLVALLKRLSDDRTLLAQIAHSLAPPPKPGTIVEAHLRLYRTGKR